MSRVVTQFDLDLAQLKLKSEQVKAEMRGMAASAKQVKLGDNLFGGNWKAASKDMKDAFDPLSRGAMVKAGGLGVGIFAATQAVRAFKGAVDELARADYLSSAQQGQMQFISGFFKDVSQERDRMMAGMATGIGDMLTGGAVSRGGADEAAGAKREATTRLMIALDAEQKKNREAAMSDAQKITALNQQRARLEERIAKAVGDQKLKLQIQREALDGSIGSLQAKSDAKQEAEKEQRLSAITRFLDAQRAAQEAAFTPAQKLLSLTQQRDEIEKKVTASKGDQVKQVELATQREQLNLQIVRDQLALAKEGADMAKAQAGDKDDFMKQFRASHQRARDWQKGEDEKEGREKENRAMKTGDHTASMDEMRARAAGKNKLADKIQKENSIVTRARSIASDLGVSPQDALGIAREESSLQDQIDKRGGGGGKEGGRKKIKGYSNAQWKTNPHMNRSGLQDLKDMQQIPFFQRINNRTASKDSTSTTQKSSDTELLARIAQGMDRLTNLQ